MLDCDALIVGGGPAGACAARALAAAGRRVVVLDRARFPREKPCGGCLRRKALDRFPWLGRALGAVPVLEVRKVRIESPDGSQALEERDEPMFLLASRRELDHALLEQARAAGAEVREGFRVLRLRWTADGVEAEGEGGQAARGRLLIGADGVNGLCARWLGLERPSGETGFALMEEATAGSGTAPAGGLRACSRDTLHVAYGVDGRMGYGYVFPKPGGVSLGRGWRLAERGVGAGAGAFEDHRRFVESLARRGIVSGVSDRARVRGWLVPYGRPPARTCARRALLCGDCAGLVNALTGEGIYYAMASGELAAAAAARALREGDLSEESLSRYEGLWRAEFGAELEQCSRIQQAFGRDLSRIDRVVRAASRDAALRAFLADYLCGRADYRSAKTFLMLRFLPVYARHKLDGLLSRAAAAWRGA